VLALSDEHFEGWIQQVARCNRKPRKKHGAAEGAVFFCQKRFDNDRIVFVVCHA
jgi:hypothetical protein